MQISNSNNDALKFRVPKTGLENFSDFNTLKESPGYKKFADRIKKSLYYGHFPSTDRPSLSVTGLLVDKFGQFCNRDGLDNLEFHDASSICYDACVTPCSVIVALLYLDRLRLHNPEYLASASPSQVFVVALMVASKYLYDDGEDDEVFNDEWATSAAMMLSDLNQAERNFLAAIDWNLYVDITQFLKGLTYIEAEVAQREALSRGGFYVYSDLVALLKLLPPLWDSFLSIIGSAFVVCIVGYTAVLTIVAAGTIITKECSIHIVSELQYRYLSTGTHTAVNLSHCVSNCMQDSDADSLEDLAPESVEEICSHIKTEREREKTPKVISVAGRRFKALHTLTTALLLASSASAKFTESISPTSLLEIPAAMWASSFLPCLNCKANHSISAFKGTLDDQAHGTLFNLNRNAYSRKRYHLRLAKQNYRGHHRVNNHLSRTEGNPSVYEWQNYLPHMGVDRDIIHGTDIEKDIIHGTNADRDTIHRTKKADTPYYQGSLVSQNLDLENNLLVTTNSFTDRIPKPGLLYVVSTNIPLGTEWHNECDLNSTRVDSWFHYTRSPIVDPSLSFLYIDQTSPDILDYLTLWMWNSLSITLSHNIRQLISWQTNFVSVFI